MLWSEKKSIKESDLTSIDLSFPERRSSRGRRSSQTASRLFRRKRGQNKDVFEWKRGKTGYSEGGTVRKLAKHLEIFTSRKAALLLHLAQPSRNVASVSWKFYQEPQPEKPSNWHKLRRSAAQKNDDPRPSSCRNGPELLDLWRKDVVLDYYQTITDWWCFDFKN